MKKRGNTPASEGGGEAEVKSEFQQPNGKEAFTLTLFNLFYFNTTLCLWESDVNLLLAGRKLCSKIFSAV